jgi:uncharacterized protein
MQAWLAAIGLTVTTVSTSSRLGAQPSAPPIIDMHMHADRADAQGPPPLAMCPGNPAGFPVGEPGRPWPDIFMERLKNPPCATPLWSPTTDRALMDRTLAVMKRRNVYGVVSGPLVEQWHQASPERIIPGLGFELGTPTALSLDAVRDAFSRGRYRSFGEVANQYQGFEPGDPAFEPYLALAEELGVPLSIHVGTGPPGAPYLGFPKYRARLHSPLLIEETLLKHPNLRVSLMHAGWPMLDDLLAVLWTHPQVHVDVGVISYLLPRAGFHAYLRRIVEAGFVKRVMFGSDQMIWPEALEAAIQALESAAFLSAAQKRDIFYNNAARFLKLSDQEIARHHGRDW